MTKSDTITEIMRLNPTVGAAFLSEFNNDDLARYLRRLREVRASKYTHQQSVNLVSIQRPRSDKLQLA